MTTQIHTKSTLSIFVAIIIELGGCHGGSEYHCSCAYVVSGDTGETSVVRYERVDCGGDSVEFHEERDITDPSFGCERQATENGGDPDTCMCVFVQTGDFCPGK